MDKFARALLTLALCGIVLTACGDGKETPALQPTEPKPTAVAPTGAATVVATAVEKAATSLPATVPATQAVASSPTVAAKPSASAVAPTATKPTTPIPAAAMVSGQPVPLADYQVQVAMAEAYFKKQGTSAQAADGEALKQVRRQVLDWMIDQMLIEQAAARMGVKVTDEQVEAEFNKAKGDDAAKFERWLKENTLTPETFRAKLRSELLGTAVRDAATSYIPAKVEQVHLRHILVKTENEARQILKQIKSNDDFVRLAKQSSIDMGTKDTGGDLGFYPRGVLSPEIDKVVFNIVVGQISDVIQTSYGFHIIQVIERDQAREVPAEMMNALRQDAFMSWLEAERGKAKIEYLVE